MEKDENAIKKDILRLKKIKRVLKYEYGRLSDNMELRKVKRAIKKLKAELE